MKFAIIAGNLDPRIGGGATLCRLLLEEMTRTPVTGSEDEVLIFVKGSRPPSERHPLGAIFSYRDEKQLPAILRRHKVDLAWFLTGGGFPPPLPLPYLATVWDLQHRTLPFLPEMQRQGEWNHREKSSRDFLQQAAAVAVGTPAGAEQIRNFYGISPEKIFCVPFPVPSWRVSRSEGQLTPALAGLAGLRPPFFFYPAQFYAHKNHAVLFHALKLLQGRQRKCQLVLSGGDCGNRPFLMNLAKELGISSMLLFPGFVTEGQLQALYAGSAGLLFPSLCGPDNLPPLEAMAAGCPVVQADTQGAREQLGEAARFVDPLDEHGWAHAMEELLAERDSSPWQQRRILAEKILQERTAAAYLGGIQEPLRRLRSLRRCWAPA